MEPPTLFKGRGKHPRAGIMKVLFYKSKIQYLYNILSLKARIMPEDITINCSKDAPIPKCELKGHNWQDVIHL